jgi:hypothetical protein
VAGIHRFNAGDDPADRTRSPVGFGAAPISDDDLSFLIEVWDDRFEAVDSLVAVAATPATAYAAFYAAVREYPGREITLRREGHVMCRWTRSAH